LAPPTPETRFEPHPEGDPTVTDKQTENLDVALRELTASFQMPDEVTAVIEAANEGIERSGVAPGVAVGEPAPTFRLPSPTGAPVSLTSRLEQGPVVVSFYRGEWCPYCNTELRALQTALPRITALGACLIAISPQRPDDALSVTEKHQLAFDVLSDADQQVIRAYRLQYSFPSDLKDLYLKAFKNDISAENADGTWNLPIPATFVIDRAGVVRARHVAVDYRTRMEPDEIIAALAALE
jgi:peroxiredoxin